MSADPDWTVYLATRGLVEEGSRVDVATTELVLIVPGTSPVALSIAPGFPLASALGDGPLAVCHPDYHPAGRYGRASLEALGVWATVAPKVARVEHVQAAVAMVGRGEAPLGIVFATDVAADARVRVVGVFPRESHPPIVFPAAAIASSRPTDTGRFLRCLKSPDASGSSRASGMRRYRDTAPADGTRAPPGRFPVRRARALALGEAACST